MLRAATAFAARRRRGHPPLPRPYAAAARRPGRHTPHTPPSPPPPSLPPGVARGAVDSLAAWALGAGKTRAVPPWVRARLNAPAGWAPRPARWLPAEWTARPGPRARVAILDALGLTPAGGVVLRALPSLAARAIAADPPPLPAPAAPPPATVRSPPPPGPVARSVTALATAAAAVAGAVELVVRSVWLAWVFAPLAFTARSALAHPPGHPDRARWIARLRVTLERAGPAFIKYGQWAATRHELFPGDVCAELEHLHARAPAHPRPVTAAAVAAAFGASLDDLFDGFPDAPVASGSIGQVYRARLSDGGARRAGLPPGTVVAVKVRHPGVEAAIARDFAIMMGAARTACRVVPALADARFDETLAQFEAPLREQVDFEHEARSLWRFCYNFRGRPGVRFPQPVYPLVSPAVLVETYETGGPIGDHVAAGPAGRYGTALARLGSDAVLHMLLVDNFVHADLHPGNILVRLDPPKRGPAGAAARALAAAGVATPRAWLRPSLVLLDVGMTTSLSEQDKEVMYELFAAFARNDGPTVARRALEFSGPKQSCKDRDAFARAMTAYFDAMAAEREAAKAPGAPPTDGAKALAGVLELVRTHGVSLPGRVSAVLVTTLVLEGWSSRLDPHHSPIAQVEAIVAPETTLVGGAAAAWADAAASGDVRCDALVNV